MKYDEREGKGSVGMGSGHNNTGGKASPMEAVKCIEKMHEGHEDHARAHPQHHRGRK